MSNNCLDTFSNLSGNHLNGFAYSCQNCLNKNQKSVCNLRRRLWRIFLADENLLTKIDSVLIKFSTQISSLFLYGKLTGNAKTIIDKRNTGYLIFMVVVIYLLHIVGDVVLIWIVNLMKDVCKTWRIGDCWWTFGTWHLLWKKSWNKMLAIWMLVY